MLRTRQILDSNLFKQTPNNTLRLSGNTTIDSLTLGAGSKLDIKSYGYSQEYFSNRYGTTFLWIASNGVTPKSENLIRIHPITDDGAGSGSTLYIMGRDGDYNSEIYHLIIDDYNFFSPGYSYSHSSANYSGDLIPEGIVESLYVPEQNSIYYIFNFNNGASESGLGKFDLSTLTNTLYTSTSGNYNGDTIENSTSVRQCLTRSDYEGSIYIHFIILGKIHRYNISTNTNTIYSSTSGNFTGSAISTTGVFVAQFDNYLYVCLGGFAASTAGLWRLDLTNNTAIKFTTTSANNNGDPVPHNSFVNVIKDVNNMLWFGTGGGLWKYDPTTNTGTKYSTTSGNYSGDSIGSVTTSYITSEGVIIFNSTPNNICCFDTVNLINKRYTPATSRAVGDFHLYGPDIMITHPYLYGYLFSNGDYIMADRNMSDGNVGNGFIKVSLNDQTSRQTVYLGTHLSGKNLNGVVDNLNIFAYDFVNKNFIDNYYLYSNEFKITNLLGNKYIELSDNFLDAVTGNTGILDFTATNGLTKNGNNVQLGGTLSGITVLSGDGSTILTINGNYENLKFIPIVNNVAQYGAESQGYIEFNKLTGEILFRDLRSTAAERKGLVYGGNYSANFVKHSLVDKHFVTGITSQITGSGGTSYVDVYQNIDIGDNNLTSVTASTRNITLGFDNLTASTRTAVENNIFIGHDLGNVDYNYAYSIDIGFDIARGGKALNGEQYVSNNHIAIGYRTMNNITGTTSTSAMIAIGMDAMNKAIARDGSNTIAIGNALNNADFELANIAIGGAGTNAVIGRHNIFIGDLAGANMSGGTPGAHGVGSTQANVAIGTHTLEYGAGNKGTFVGCEAGSGRIRGQANSGFGNWSLPRSFGDYNNGLGSFAGYHATTILTGSTNTFVGWRSSYSTPSLTNSIVLAHNYEAALSNRVYLGSTTQKVILTATPTSGSTSQDVLVRNSSTGEIETTSNSFWKTNGSTNITQDFDINVGSTYWNIGQGDGVAITRDGGAIYGFDGTIAVGHFSATNSSESTIYFSENSITIQANVGVFPGITYGSDFSNQFTDNSLVDKNFVISKGRKKTVENYTSNKILTVNDISKVFTNSGATGSNDYNLPVLTTADIGTVYTFYIIANQNFRIKANTGQTIRSGSVVTAPGGYLISNTIGNTVTLVAISTTSWVDIALGGTWTAIAP